MLAVLVRFLFQNSVPRNKPAHLRIIVPRPNVKKTGIPIIPIPTGSRELVGICARTCCCNGKPKTILNDGASYRLAGVCHRPLTPQPIKQRILAILPDQRVSIGVSRRERAALLFLQDLRSVIEEPCGRSAACAAEAPAYSIIGKARDVCALGDRSQLAVIVVCQRIAR